MKAKINFTKNWNQRYKYLVFGREDPFVKEHSDSKSKYTAEDTLKMLDNIFVVFAEIPTDNQHCAPVLADIFL